MSLCFVVCFAFLFHKKTFFIYHSVLYLTVFIDICSVYLISFYSHDDLFHAFTYASYAMIAFYVYEIQNTLRSRKLLIIEYYIIHPTGHAGYVNLLAYESMMSRFVKDGMVTEIHLYNTIIIRFHFDYLFINDLEFLIFASRTE